MATQRKGAKVAPAPVAATAGTPSKSGSAAAARPQSKPFAWWILRLFRLFSLGTAAWVLYPKLFPKAPVVDPYLVKGRVTYEPIELDQNKRDAVLEAFKVRAGR